jgi:hypothetical protein
MDPLAASVGAIDAIGEATIGQMVQQKVFLVTYISYWVRSFAY